MLTTQSEATETSAGLFAPKSVLILDSRGERLQSLRVVLTGAGHKVDIASEAGAGLTKWHGCRPEVILVDLQLRGPGGLPLAQSLLVDADFADIPMIALTADRHASDRCRELGDLFDEYLCDPVEPAELLRQIQELSAKQAEANPARAPAGSDPAPLVSVQMPAEGLLENIEAGLPESQFAAATGACLNQWALSLVRGEGARLGDCFRQAQTLTAARTARGRIGFRWLIRLCRDLLGRDPDPAPALEELRSEYLENRWVELGALAAALDRSDFAALAPAGHNLKGTGAAYGFVELTELGRALEAAAKSKDALQVEVLLGKTRFYLSLARSCPIDR